MHISVIGMENPLILVILQAYICMFVLQLAGVIEPNDFKCYVNNQGKYTKPTDFDYPSISQVSRASSQLLHKYMSHVETATF